MHIFPNSLDFGNVKLCSSYERSIGIYNDWVEPIRIDTLTLPNSDITVSGVCDLILPGDSCIVKIHYTPSDLGRKIYILPITSVKFSKTCVSTVYLSANVSSPLRYSRSKIDFGNLIGLDLDHQDSLTLYNNGIVNLTLDTVYCDNKEISANMRSKVIPPGDSCSIIFTYHPRVYGRMNCTVELSFNGKRVTGDIFISARVMPRVEQEWEQTPLDSVNVSGFAVIPDGSGVMKLFVSNWSSGIYLSTDGGTNWTKINSDLIAKPISCITVNFDHTGKENIFVGTYGKGIFRSTNNGTSWIDVNSELPYTYITSFVISPDGIGGENLFAGTFGNGVFLSTDNGENWNQAGLPSMAVHSLVVSPNDEDTTIYAGTNKGVFLSINNGTSWTSCNDGLTSTDVRALAISSNESGGTNIFAGTNGKGIFLSTNNGTSWNPANTGLTDSIVNCFVVTGTNVFSGTAHCLYLSTNNGNSWTPVSTGGIFNLGISALAVSGTNVFAGTMYGVWRRQLSEMITDVKISLHELPTEYALNQNYPNPFNPTTTINYQLPTQSQVTLKVFDVLGREVATLTNGVEEPGYKSVTFDANRLPSGVYFYRIQAGSFVETKKLLLIR